MKYIPPFGAAPVNSIDCVAKTTTPLCDTVNILLPAKFFIKKISLTLLFIVNEPVITALPENGNTFAVKACDAVTANDDVILYNPREKIKGSIVCHLGEIHLKKKDKGKILENLIIS